MDRAHLSNDTVCLCCDPSLLVFFPTIPYIVVACRVEGVGVPWRRHKAVCGFAPEQQKARCLIWTDLSLLS